jgi:TrmH family RNA methyltransferase
MGEGREPNETSMILDRRIAWRTNELKQESRAKTVDRSRLRPLEGRHNPLVKELRRAFANGDLTPDGHCAIEGLRIVEEAIRSGLRFRAVFFRNSAAQRADRLLPQMAAYVEMLVLPDKLFAAAVPSETPQGVAALVRCRQFSLEEVFAKAETGPLVAVAGIQDPGNLGTILRSAEAFGAGGVLLGEGTASPFNSKVIRGSAGSIFRLPLAKVRLGEALDQLRAHGVRLIATSSHHRSPLPEANLGLPLAILIGSEAAGVPQELLAKVDQVVGIPHSSSVESLNAGVAASIVLYEAARQKRA